MNLIPFRFCHIKRTKVFIRTACTRIFVLLAVGFLHLDIVFGASNPSSCNEESARKATRTTIQAQGYRGPLTFLHENALRATLSRFVQHDFAIYTVRQGGLTVDAEGVLGKDVFSHPHLWRVAVDRQDCSVTRLYGFDVNQSLDRLVPRDLLPLTSMAAKTLVALYMQLGYSVDAIVVESSPEVISFLRDRLLEELGEEGAEGFVERWEARHATTLEHWVASTSVLEQEGSYLVTLSVALNLLRSSDVPKMQVRQVQLQVTDKGRLFVVEDRLVADSEVVLEH